MSLILWLTLGARAAEVLWLTPPTDADRTRIGERAGATRPALTVVDLLASTSGFTEADERALRDLDGALAQARTFESTLDGELLILRDLEGPVSRVGLLRDDADRQRLFAALVYQGFAANRYFGDELATAPDAAPWRVELDGRTYERPWTDAAALEPARDASPYEIAEAPQRVAYNQRRLTLASALPASLTPTDLPPGSVLKVDGRVATPGPAGNLKVPPGRHLVHLELDGRILARWDLRLAPAADEALTLPLPPAALERWLAEATDGTPVPAEIGARIAAVGGEVWLARADGDGLVVRSVTPQGVRSVEVAPEPPAPRDRRGPPVEVSVGALAGWLSSGDFYAQDPLQAPRSRATVNAAALGGWASADLGVGPLRVGAGVDLLATPGAHHVALTGDQALRLRPIPHLAIGLRSAQLTAGWLFPYHPAVGARVALPLPGPLVTRAAFHAGLPGARTRADGSTWESLPVWTLTGGLGARF